MTFCPILLAGGNAPPAVASDATLNVVRALSDQDAKVLDIGERLIVAGRPLCSGATGSVGLTVQRLAQYGGDYRAAARQLLGIANRPTVTVIAPGGAAERAGIRRGDVLLSVNGRAFPDDAPRRKAGDFAGTAEVLDVLDAAVARGRVELAIQRGTAVLTVMVIPRAACHARFDVRAGRANNASSDGITVQISSDLVARAQNDGEIAAILAHELAHNILRHPQRLEAREQGLSTRRTEMEADRLSVWLLDAAGFAPADAAAFWRRWGKSRDYGIFSDGSHPRWRDRATAIEAEAAAIAALRTSGRPVVPPPELQPRP